MKIVYSDEFRKQFHTLPVRVQNLCHKQEAIFQQNWKDSRLHGKKLADHNLAFSFRITRRYRVLFIFTDAQTVLFVTIGHRKDVYR